MKLEDYPHQCITPGDAAKCEDVPFNSQQIGYLASCGLFQYTTAHHTKLIFLKSLIQFLEIIKSNGILVEKN